MALFTGQKANCLDARMVTCLRVAFKVEARQSATRSILIALPTGTSRWSAKSLIADN